MTKRLLILLLAFALASCEGTLLAATVTMTKSGGGAWSDPTLWDAGAPPGPGDTAVIAAAEASTVVVDAPVTVARLEVGTTANTRWQTVSLGEFPLTVTGDLILVRYGKLYQGPGSSVTAQRYLLSSYFSGGSTMSQVHWEIRGTAGNRAKVIGASSTSSIDVNSDTANGGHASAFTADQKIEWNYADIEVKGKMSLPVAGTAIAKLQIDHCLFSGSGAFTAGLYLKSSTHIDFTNNDFRSKGSNPLAKDGSGNVLVLRRQQPTGTGARTNISGNVITWTPSLMEAAGVTFYNAGGTFTISENLFNDVIIYFNVTTPSVAAPDLYNVYSNLFFTTAAVTISGAMIQSYYGLNFHDNLLMAQNNNAHIYKGVGSGGCAGPKDYIFNNVFDVQDTGADIIMVGRSSIEAKKNLFLGAGTPINLGLSGSNIPSDTVDPMTIGCTVDVRRNTVYTSGAASISGILIWEGETTYHGGTVTAASNLVGDWTNANTLGVASDDYLIGKVFPDSVDWIDYTWWWNANGGTLDRYKSITITGKSEGADLGFGLHDVEGDPQFKNPFARVLTMDSYLHNDTEGSELRALDEFKKRNQNVPGDVFIPQYTVPIATAYLRAAMTPMNLGLNDSGLEGDDIGAIDLTGIPAAPAAPTLVSTTPTSLTLTWPEPPGSVVGDYDLQVRPVGALNWADYALSYAEYLKDLLNYARTTVAGLEAGTPYEFRVRAGNALGYSDWSAASAAFTPLGPPGAPTGLSVLGGNAEATLSFFPPSNTGGVPLTGYRVTVSPGGMTVDTTESPVTITNLENNVNYTLSIVAMNVAYSGSPATISVTPHAPLPPEPPELMTPLRRPNQAFEWVHQFAVAPTAPGQTCVEGQHAWDDTYLYVCVSGGRWVYFQPNKLW